MTRNSRYDDGAYAPNGELWWRLRTHPGTTRRYGDERKIAAWLAFNVREGDTFTMRDLRRALGTGPGRRNEAEHLNRRFRSLRPDGWRVSSYRSEKGLPVDTYRLVKVGWHPGLDAARPKRTRVSSDLQRRVIERDHRRCVICGVGSCEPYPGEPDTAAALTAGHRIPSQRDSRPRSMDELQAECQRCNETVRDELPDPPTLAEVRPDIARLNTAERDQLFRWLLVGYRLRSRLDDVYDRVRMLTPDEREVVKDELRAMLGIKEWRSRREENAEENDGD